MGTVSLRWQVLLMVGLFIWHEIEEYFVLLPWLSHSRNQLSYPFNKVAIRNSSFIIIAVEELLLLMLVSLLLPPIWFMGAIIAYAIHLLVHCVQMLYSAAHHIPLNLWSAPIQLPICLLILYFALAGEKGNLLVAGIAMTSVMVINLALMYLLTHAK